MELYTQPPKRNFQPVVVPQDVPVYRVGEEKFYADDRLFEAGEIIEYDDEPNQFLEPLNDMAVQKMSEFLEKLDVFGREAAKEAKKSYVSYKDAFQNAYALAEKDGRKVRLLTDKESVPVFGGKKRGRPPRARSIQLQQEVATVEKVGGRKAVNDAIGKNLKDA